MKLSLHIIFLLLLVSGCKPVAKLISLSPRDFYTQMNASAKKHLIDVRNKGAYDAGHIPGAINIAIDSPNFDSTLKHFDKSVPLFIYGNPDSIMLSDHLQGVAISNIYFLRGGFAAWKNKHLPVDSLPTAALKPVISIADYQQFIHDHPLVLVDFNASWCPPCRMEAPIVENIAHEKGDSLLFLDVDVDVNGALAQSEHIEALPTLKIYKHGQEVWKTIGYTEGPVILHHLKME